MSTTALEKLWEPVETRWWRVSKLQLAIS